MSSPALDGSAPDSSAVPPPAPDPARLPALERLRRPFAIVAWLIVAMSVLKTMRKPSSWAATHLTFNYSHGFIRRGLVGQLVRMVGDPWIYKYIYLADGCYLLFVLVAAVLAYLVRAAIRADDGDFSLRAAVLVFAAAPALVVFVHVIGYLDYHGLLLLLCFVLYARRARRLPLVLAAGLGLGVTLALIHEVLVVMFAPIALFVMLCRIASDAMARRAGGTPRTGRTLLLMAGAGAITALSLVASVAVGTLGSRDAAAIAALQSSMGAKVNFGLRGDAFAALVRSANENVMSLMPGFWRDAWNRQFLITGLVVTFPAVGFLIYYGVRLIRRFADDGVPAWTRRILIAVLVGASVVPELLNLVGWDSGRWNAACLLSAFIGVLCLRLFFTARSAQPARHRLDDQLTLTLAGAATVVGLCGTNYAGYLFDGYTVQWFPFVDQLRDALEVVRHGLKRPP